MQRIIGTTTTYHGTEHRFLTGATVRIVALVREGTGPDGACEAYLDEDEAIARSGGIHATDRVEVQPWLERQRRFSFVTSDPLAADLAAFAHLAR